MKIRLTSFRGVRSSTTTILVGEKLTRVGASTVRLQYRGLRRLGLSRIDARWVTISLLQAGYIAGVTDIARTIGVRR